MDFLFSKKDIETLRRLSFRQILGQAVNACYSIMITYMFWKALCFFLQNDSPIVCVLSESMEPGFARGDIIFLTRKEYRTGDICVYQVYKNSIPIVHRVIRKVGEKLLTKGDNNMGNDIGLYRPGRTSLEPHETRAGVFGYIPYFGMPTIWMNAVPGLKYVILALVAKSVFATRQED